MLALIFEEMVVQIEAAAFPVATELEWIDIGAATPAPEVGWRYDGTSFAPPQGPSLDALVDAKRLDFIAEGVSRVALQVPDWDTLDTIKTVAGLWASHLAANATVAQTTAKDIYLYVRDTVPAKLAAVADQAELDAIDPTAADPFGDGTPWPT